MGLGHLSPEFPTPIFHPDNSQQFLSSIPFAGTAAINGVKPIQGHDHKLKNQSRSVN
jgi:hypothetical protein